MPFPQVAVDSAVLGAQLIATEVTTLAIQEQPGAGEYPISMEWLKGKKNNTGNPQKNIRALSAEFPAIDPFNQFSTRSLPNKNSDDSYQQRQINQGKQLPALHSLVHMKS